MLSMHDLMDMRMQQQLAHELYRQQIMQRIPGKWALDNQTRCPSADGKA